MTFSKAIAVALAGLMTASMISAATPVLAGDTVLETIDCVGNIRAIHHFYSYKKADSMSIKTVGPDLYRVTLTKNGKKGVYEFDGCTKQSRKIS